MTTQAKTPKVECQVQFTKMNQKGPQLLTITDLEDPNLKTLIDASATVSFRIFEDGKCVRSLQVNARRAYDDWKKAVQS